MGVVKASLTLPAFSFHQDTTTTYKHTLRIFPTFSKFTLLTSTPFYILFNSIHDNCNTYNQKKVKFYQKPKSLVVWIGET